MNKSINNLVDDVISSFDVKQLSKIANNVTSVRINSKLLDNNNINLFVVKKTFANSEFIEKLEKLHKLAYRNKNHYNFKHHDDYVVICNTAEYTAINKIEDLSSKAFDYSEKYTLISVTDIISSIDFSNLALSKISTHIQDIDDLKTNIEKRYINKKSVSLSL